MVNLKKMMAAVAIVGAFGFTALGPGLGVANAVSPGMFGTPLPQDDGGGGGWWWGPGHGHGPGPGWVPPGHRYGPGYGGPGYGYGPGVYACISATGPFGYVSGSACI